jgi:hypothetical protein
LAVGARVEEAFQAMEMLDFYTAQNIIQELFTNNTLSTWGPHSVLMGSLLTMLNSNTPDRNQFYTFLSKYTDNEDFTYVSSLVQIIDFYSNISSIPDHYLAQYINALRQSAPDMQSGLTIRQNKLITALIQLGPLLEYHKSVDESDFIPSVPALNKRNEASNEQKCEDCTSKLINTISTIQALGRRDINALPKAVLLLNTSNLKEAKPLFRELVDVVSSNSNPIIDILLLIELFPSILDVHPSLISRNDGKFILEKIIVRLEDIEANRQGSIPMGFALPIGVAISNLSQYVYGSTKKVDSLLQKYLNESYLSINSVGSRLLINWLSSALSNPYKVFQEIKLFATQLSALPIVDRTYEEKQTLALANTFLMFINLFSDEPEKAKKYLKKGLIA